MRLEFSYSEFSQNCGILEVGGFELFEENSWSHYTDKVPTEDQWWDGLHEKLVTTMDDDLSTYGLVVFSASTDQKGNAISPITFAKWLRSKKQKISETPWVLNPNSGNKIKMFTWAPSKAFRKKLENYKKKNNDAERGTRAA